MSTSPLGTVSYRSSKTPELFQKLHSVALSCGHAGIYTTLKCLDADIYKKNTTALLFCDPQIKALNFQRQQLTAPKLRRRSAQ